MFAALAVRDGVGQAVVGKERLSGRRPGPAARLHHQQHGFVADLGYTAATKCTVRDLVVRRDLGMFTGAYESHIAADTTA